jgi:hypothetical protein
MLIALTILRLPFLLLKLPYRGGSWLVGRIVEFFWRMGRMIRAILRVIWATPGMVFIHGPVGVYRRIVRFRNWLLAKVEYIQSESQKWRTAFSIARSPYSLLRGMGLSPQMAISFLVAGSAVGGGVVVNETLLQEKSFARGDAGVFSAPSDVPTFFSAEYNTLRVDLGTTAVKLLEISDVSIGTSYTGSALPSGTTTTIDVGGNAAASTYLIVGEMLFEKNRCETLALSDINVHVLNIVDNYSDGQSIAPTASSGIRNRAVLGGYVMAQDMSTKGGLYDRIWVQAPNSGVNGRVDNLVLSNIYTRGGGCLLSRIRGGTLTIRLNEIGGDSNLATKAFTVGTGVKASVINNTGNVEAVFAVPATQTIDE